MSFSSITIGATTWVERSKGIYIPTTLNFGDPENYLSLRANSNSKQPSVTVKRLKQIQVGTDPLTAKRISLLATLSLQMPLDANATPALMAGIIADIGTFASAANVGRLFQGES